ncbi:hypothetical protein AB0C52_15035 [Streptomyces sp. NPDC048717]|uniref:hypothetical protein n=1 Tax=Streptomyces sp. NPDC048717 TaxID=3154928 RepID=UPI00343D5D45
MNRLRVLAAAPFALVLAVYLSLLTTWYDRLPDPLATHFSGAGDHPDGFTGLGAYAVGSTVVLLAFGAGWVLWVRRFSLWGAWATAGFTGTLAPLLLRGNLDVADAAGADFPFALVSLGTVAGALAALVGLGLTRLVPKDPAAGSADAPAADRIDLGTGEVAGWSHGITSPFLSLLAIAFIVAGLGALALTPWPSAPLGLLGPVIGVPGLALARIRVTVDRRGLTVVSSVLPRPRIRIPLSDITAATARDINPVADFGGWGYRVRPHRTGLVLRGGEALVIRRPSGREFAVTVPDAGTAAALLNTLRERAASDHGPTGGPMGPAADDERI